MHGMVVFEVGLMPQKGKVAAGLGAGKRVSRPGGLERNQLSKSTRSAPEGGHAVANPTAAPTQGAGGVCKAVMARSRMHDEAKISENLGKSSHKAGKNV